MKKFKYLISLVLLLLISVVMFDLPVQANETSSSSQSGFYYDIDFPDNQTDADASYFNLRMSPGQQQKVHIDFTNVGSEDLVLSIGLYGAKTNQNGVVEFGPTVLENDPSLKHPFEDVVKGPSELTLKGNSTTPLELNITMPNESFDGEIAGGIWFQTKQEEDPDATGVQQRTAYIIGMVLTENDTVVTPDLQLNDVYAKLNNYRGAIYIDFSNVTMTFVENVTVNTSIAAKDSPDDVLYDSKTSGMRMAPNSFMTYPVSLNGEPYIPGNYIADITVTSGDQEWHWTKEFEITRQEADDLNEQDVTIVQEKGFDWWLIGGIAVGVIGLIVVVYLIIHFRNKRKKRQRRQNNRKNKNGKSKLVKS